MDYIKAQRRRSVRVRSPCFPKPKSQRSARLDEKKKVYMYTNNKVSDSDSDSDSDSVHSLRHHAGLHR